MQLSHIVCGMGISNITIVVKDNKVLVPKMILEIHRYIAAKLGLGIDALIEMDAAVTAMNNLGQTPLMLAAKSSCSLSSVTVLLKWGARVNNSDYNGKSSLHYAFEAYKEIMVLQRMVHGADLFAKFWRNSISLRKLSHGKKVGSSTIKHLKKKPDEKACYGTTSIQRWRWANTNL